MNSLFSQVHAAVSDNGLLAYVAGQDRAIGRVACVDGRGHAEFLPVPAHENRGLRGGQISIFSF
jgi:hypothetical protein